MIKIVSQIAGAEMNFLAIDTGTTEQPFGKDKIRSISHTVHKNKLSVNQASKLKKKNETIQVLEEIIGEFLFNLGIHKEFLIMEKWLNSRLDKEIIEIPCYAIKLKKSLKIIVICLNYTGTSLKGLSLAKSGIM